MLCSRSTHGTVQYFLMLFTASIHTGGHTLLSLQSRSCRDRIKRYFDQSVIGARVERDCQCEHWPESSYGSAGLGRGCIACSLYLPRCLHHGNEESTGVTEGRADHEWSEECECIRNWPYREWSLNRDGPDLWCESGLRQQSHVQRLNKMEGFFAHYYVEIYSVLVK